MRDMCAEEEFSHVASPLPYIGKKGKGTRAVGAPLTKPR